MNKPKTNRWLFALALASPLLIFFIGYIFNHSESLIPTGFSQYDNVSYVAYAKQYFDADTFHPGYSNPFNNGSSPAIYFQPHTLFFALLLYIGVPPGIILIPFVIICAIVCFRLVIAIYDTVANDDDKRVLNIWLFSWGGGLLVIGSSFAHAALKTGHPFLNDLFMLDPEGGWWGLNFGRSVVFCCEGFYHAIFLGCIYCLLKRKWTGAMLLLLLISSSHPFTGIELICIVAGWCLLEFLFFKRSVPLFMVAGTLILLCFHIYYYLFYLNSFEVHRSVSQQYALNWRLGWYRILPAYCIVGILAIVSIAKKSFKAFFSNTWNRLFACWFIIAFLLANHEVFMRPMQPIHFTRGYIWASLFLLGLPALRQLHLYIDRRWHRPGLCFFAFLFFFDNLLWISTHVAVRAKQPYATYITAEQKNLFHLLDQESNNQTLIVSSDETIAYLSTVYTKASPWYSHPYTTSFAEDKRRKQAAFFNEGKLDSSWKQCAVNFVLMRSDTLAFKSLLTLPAEKILKTGQYIIFKFAPPKLEQ